MGKVWAQYTGELFHQFGYLAAWTPGTRWELGDVAVGWPYQRLTNVRKLGLDFEVREDTSKEAQSYASSGSTSISFKAAGSAPAVGSILTQGEAGVTVEFKRARSTVYQAVGCVAPSIEDQATLGQQIRELFKQGKWAKNWIVVTELVMADSATILISQSRDSKVELIAKGQAGAGTSLASLNAGFEIASARNMEVSLVSAEKLTPLYKARGLKWGGAVGQLGIRSVGAHNVMTPAALRESADIYFGEIGLPTYAEFDLPALERMNDD